MFKAFPRENNTQTGFYLFLIKTKPLILSQILSFWTSKLTFSVVDNIITLVQVRPGIACTTISVDKVLCVKYRIITRLTCLTHSRYRYQWINSLTWISEIPDRTAEFTYAQRQIQGSSRMRAFYFFDTAQLMNATKPELSEMPLKY